MGDAQDDEANVSAVIQLGRARVTRTKRLVAEALLAPTSVETVKQLLVAAHRIRSAACFEALVYRYLEQLDPNAELTCGRTLCFLAAELGSIPAMKKLYSRGADLQRPGAKGTHAAINSPGALSWLGANGVSLDGTLGFGLTL